MYKLIRDKIPELVAAADAENKQRFDYAAVQNDGFYKDLLKAKLVEEVTEFLQSGEVEELVDVLTVVNTLVKVLGVKDEDFKKLYDIKLNEKGGFEKGFIAFFPDQGTEE